MKKMFATLALTSAMALAPLAAADAPSKVGIVNFGTCLTDSKVGKHEQGEFEKMRKQMASLVEDTEKQLREISDKFNDKDFLDGLSPEAEDEMKNKFRNLSEELNRYQQQYYQVMQQANMRLFQVMSGHINDASEKVAAGKHLNMIMNKEMCFFHQPALDVTADVIKEMDKAFETDAKKQTAAAPVPAKEEVKKQTAAAPAPVKEEVKK